MDIKVGEHVRTIRGIGKILEIKTVKTKMDGNHDKSYKLDRFKSLWFSKMDFIKHSFELKEVLEKGDYVNGFEVNRIDGDVIVVKDFAGLTRGIEAKNIKTIVTKEQFDREKYIVGG